jgi:hypothetical protein
MKTAVKFEADLLNYPRPTAGQRFILKTCLVVLFISVAGLIGNGIYSALTGLTSLTVVFSFALAMLLSIAFIAYGVIFKPEQKVIGRLVIDEHQIATNDHIFLLQNIQTATVFAANYEGQKYSSDASDGDGVCYLRIEQGGLEFNCRYIVRNGSQLQQLYDLVHTINAQQKRPLLELI